MLLICTSVCTTLPLCGQEAPEHLILIMPFENASKTASMDWISEAFPEVIGKRLGMEDALFISRTDRMYAYDHMGIPAGAKPSRATIIRIAQEMDVDMVFMGKYESDGRTLTVHAQILNINTLRMTPEVAESGSMQDMMGILNALAWDLLHSSAFHGPPAGDNIANKRAYMTEVASPKLDVFEKYVRGVTTSGQKEKTALLREAVKLGPDFDEARFALAKSLFENKDYEEAAQNLRAVSDQSIHANESRFFAGLAELYTGHADRAEESFSFVVRNLPLVEAVNNLGVAQARRGKKAATEQFRKVSELDPIDADYHFNLGLSLWRNGAMQEAIEQLKDAYTLRPGDTEAKALHDALTVGKAVDHPPQERIKNNYDETSYRQLQLEIERARKYKPHIP
jgi:tetratricopeptide (TPR) repeat protein/TolB-like protein